MVGVFFFFGLCVFFVAVVVVVVGFFFFFVFFFASDQPHLPPTVRPIILVCCIADFSKTYIVQTYLSLTKIPRMSLDLSSEMFIWNQSELATCLSETFAQCGVFWSLSCRTKLNSNVAVLFVMMCVQRHWGEPTMACKRSQFCNGKQNNSNKKES